MAACRNVEVKARVVSDDVLQEIKKLANSDPELIVQADYFFNVPQGRLKLRSLETVGRWELIYYDRPDCDGPKLSDYRKVDVEDGKGLLEVLKCSLGVKGQVLKRRLLFMYGQTRIHYDEVEKLGTFMELEVMLREEQSVDDGMEIANDILDKLGVSKEHFITGAYMDLLHGLVDMADIPQLVAQKNKQRAAMKREYFKLLTNPFAGEGHVFDAAIQRHAAMRVTKIEHFRETPKNTLLMLAMIVIPIVATGLMFKNDKETKEAAIRSGNVAYKDRLFKFQ